MQLDVMMQSELFRLKESGLYGVIRCNEGAQGSWLEIEGRRVLNFCSNNYLGLANDAYVCSKVMEAVERYGVGPGAVRTIAGTMSLHLELERRLAAFKGTEAAITFQSGFCANLAVIPSLMVAGDIIFSDSLNHASIIDACRLSKARVVRYSHSDMCDLRLKLEETRGESGKKLIVTDGVFSMDGDIAKLPEIVEIAQAYGAIVAVDDAHGEGVLGRGGRGIVDHFGLHGMVDIEIGTMSKAFGCVGGMVAGSSVLIEFLRQKARVNLFSSAMTVPDLAANLAALDILEGSDDRVKRLWSNGEYVKSGLRSLGYDVGHSETPIIPVMIGEASEAKLLSVRLFEAGVFVTSIVYPTVPQGTARLRVMVSASHSQEDLDFGLEQFRVLGGY